MFRIRQDGLVSMPIYQAVFLDLSWLGNEVHKWGIDDVV